MFCYATCFFGNVKVCYVLCYLYVELCYISVYYVRVIHHVAFSALLLQGCKKQLSDWLQENVLTIFGMDFGLMLIQVIKQKSVSK